MVILISTGALMIRAVWKRFGLFRLGHALMSSSVNILPMHM